MHNSLHLSPEEDDEEWEHVTQPEDNISVLSTSTTTLDNADTATVNSEQTYVQISPPSFQGRHIQHPTEAPSGPIPSLRKSLYALKDSLKEAVDQILQLLPRLYGSGAVALRGLRSRVKNVLDVLNTLLTNSSEDWAVQGEGLNYDEFTELDGGIIDGVQVVIEEFAEVLRGKKYSNICFRADHAGCRHAQDEEDGEVGLDDVELDEVYQGVRALEKLLRVGPAEGKDGDTETLVGDHDREKESVDKKVHQRMMMVSDW